MIAAVNGWAAGAGLYLMLASTDIRIACSEHARFKFALLSQGWLGAGPGATLLSKQLSYADAMRILLTDEPSDAAEALCIGLINEVVAHDDLLARAPELALQIAEMPPIAVRLMKEFVIRYREMPVDSAWHVQNLMNTMLIQMTTDGRWCVRPDAVCGWCCPADLLPLYGGPGVNPCEAARSLLRVFGSHRTDWLAFPRQVVFGWDRLRSHPGRHRMKQLRR